MLVDGKPTERTFETLEGTVGSGEFGATLNAIFDPAERRRPARRNAGTKHAPRPLARDPAPHTMLRL
jgi:hypothetical protein